MKTQDLNVMKWQLDGSAIFNQDNSIVAVTVDRTTRDEKIIIEKAPDAFKAIAEFMSDVDNGSMKPRAAYKRFEKLFEKAEIEN